ncbi:hypothetical protein [Treponema brennaborense]|uniref:Glycosyl transferase family 2 n=1 Tax=Treponema brennaborense (strain DSM 12168 / CIP 105900 / DD5/3) TaxID=906968 RepID=F4LIE0_TREBD|nr:hypothetical protein [Treponema brennaborense]AEE16181.1 hypothetical protein Trebr_0742 [Treponema brennaborense DSM 12168]
MELNEKSVAICILARDVESALYRNIPKLDVLRKYFMNSWIIVVENDSKDRTKDVLHAWQKKNEQILIDSHDGIDISSVSYFSDNSFSGTCRNRIEKMVAVRNKYLQIMKQKSIHTDYIVIIDIDLDNFDEKEIVQAIKNAPYDWSAIFANGLLYATVLGRPVFTKFYDTYAYVPANSKTNQLTYKEQYLNREIKTKKNDYILCRSAFGGIGIYKYESIIDAVYSTQENKRSQVEEVICEHISVNEYANNFGRNYICNDLKTYYQKISFLVAILPTWIFMKIQEIKNHRKFPE